MEYKRILKDGIHLFAGKLGTVAISIIDLMLLARILTTEQMGKYSLFLMIVNLALIIGLNWSDASVVRHGREEYVKSRKINRSFWARMYIFIPVIVLFTVIFVIFSNQIASYIGIDPHLIVLLIIMFILNGLMNFITSVYQSINRMKKSAYVPFLQKLFYLFCLALVALNIFKANLTIILIFINLSFLLSIIFNIVGFNFQKISPYHFSKAYFKKIWNYSWPQLIGFPGLYIVNYIDLFVIKKYLALSDVGVYSMAYNGFTNICAFVMIIYTVFMPLIVEYRAKKRFNMIKNYTKKIPIFAGIWIVLVLIGVLMADYIIPLIFSAKYTASIPSFKILLVASIFYFVSICLLPLINAFDLILFSQVFNLIKALVNIAGDFILVPKMGIVGAAYSTAASFLIGMLLSITLIRLKRKLIFGLDKKGISKKIIAGGESTEDENL